MKQLLQIWIFRTKLTPLHFRVASQAHFLYPSWNTYRITADYANYALNFSYIVGWLSLPW